MTNRLQSLNIDIDDPLETVDDVENWNTFSTRLKAVLQDLIKGPREIKTVFTHGGCIKGFLRLILPKLASESLGCSKADLLNAFTPPVPNCSVYCLTVEVKDDFIVYMDMVTL